MKPGSGARSRGVKLVGAISAGAVVAGGAVVASRAALRRWDAAPDPTGGTPLGFPDGEDLDVPTPDGGTLSCTVAGPPDGRLFVLAHGWTENRRMWGPVADRLVDAGYRVAAYDQRGHGKSEGGSAGFTLEAIADDLKAVIDRLDARRAILVGHSMGGMAVQAFAIAYPDVVAERAGGLVLVSTASGDVGYGRAWTAAVARVTANPLMDAAMRRPRLGPLLVRSVVGRAPCTSHLRATGEMFLDTPAATRAAFARSLATLNLYEGLPSIATPVVVVSGTRDFLLPHHLSKKCVRGIPGARLEVVPGAGHQLPFEDPDRVASILVASATSSADAGLKLTTTGPR